MFCIIIPRAHAADRGCLRHLEPVELHSPRNSCKHLPTATRGSVGDEQLLTYQGPQYNNLVLFGENNLLWFLSETTTRHLAWEAAARGTESEGESLPGLPGGTEFSRSVTPCHCSLRHHAHPEAREAPEKHRWKEGKFFHATSSSSVSVHAGRGTRSRCCLCCCHTQQHPPARENGVVGNSSGLLPLQQRDACST
ncbi:unnamed protein product [Ectocarpus sp. 12 AP-2014]